MELMLISLLTPVYSLSKLTVFNFEFNNSETNLVSQFNNWRTSEQERISQLKITLPTNLLGIFEEIRKQGDPSSK